LSSCTIGTGCPIALSSTSRKRVAHVRRSCPTALQCPHRRCLFRISNAGCLAVTTSITCSIIAFILDCCCCWLPRTGTDELCQFFLCFFVCFFFFLVLDFFFLEAVFFFFPVPPAGPNPVVKNPGCFLHSWFCPGLLE